MKIITKRLDKPFSPIKVEILLETREEFDALSAVANYSDDVASKLSNGEYTGHCAKKESIGNVLFALWGKLLEYKDS